MALITTTASLEESLGQERFLADHAAPGWDRISTSCVESVGHEG